MQPFNKATATLAFGLVLSMLAGCSEYLDRRDTVSLGAGNAIATDQVTHMVDPWPRASAKRDIAFDGNKMESAFERYRTNQVIQPKGTGTSATYQQNNTTPIGPTVTSQPAPVK